LKASIDEYLHVTDKNFGAYQLKTFSSMVHFWSST